MTLDGPDLPFSFYISFSNEMSLDYSHLEHFATDEPLEQQRQPIIRSRIEGQISIKKSVLSFPKRLSSDHVNAHRGSRAQLVQPRNQGVFLVMTQNAFVPVKRDNSVNTYLRILTVPQGSERSE